jgi:hypothetical protein
MTELSWRSETPSVLGEVLGSYIWSQQLPGSFLAVASWVATQQHILPQGTEEEENRKNYIVCNPNKSQRIYDLILLQYH